MTRGVRVARVERGREHLDGADIGELGLGLGRLQRRHHVIERLGERIELAARSRLSILREKSCDEAIWPSCCES